VRQILRRVWIGAGLAFTAWLVAGFQAVDVPESVTGRATDEGIVFEPTGPRRPVGLLFLPGGMVDPVAYAPLLHGLAREGIEARLLYLPWRAAMTEGQRADLFARIRQQTGRWVLAGHSRGAMLAARFAREHPEHLAGLALIATTHPRDFSLADLREPVMKIFGTRDGVAPPAAMEENRGRLPGDTQWVAIEGGNHVQFGYYRHQLFDGVAAISREEQTARTRQALLELLNRVR